MKIDRKVFFIGTGIVLVLFVILFSNAITGMFGGGNNTCKKTAVLIYSDMCPHCADELKMLNENPNIKEFVKILNIKSAEAKPYVEKYKIEYIPFWVWGDGSTSVGKIGLDELSRKLSCNI